MSSVGLPQRTTGRRRSVGGMTPAQAAGQAPAIPAPSKSLKLVYLMWFFALFDPQWFVASVSSDAVLRIPTVIYGVLAVIVLFQVPRIWILPFFLFVLQGVLTSRFTYDFGRALTGIKPLVLMYILSVATLRIVDSPRRAAPIISALFFTQFIWWGLWGTKGGRVKWHYQYNNFDAFGPLALIGAAGAFYYALATPSRKVKIVAFGTSALCMLGLVSSFARGAVVAAVAVMGYMWLRSRRKGVMTLGLVGALLVAIAGSAIFVGVNRGGDTRSTFFAEMATIARGTDDATGSDRKELWTAAWYVFLANPVLGAGVENFGPYAAANLAVGSIGGAYGVNPARLYNRGLHSSFAQILSEMGIVGSSLFIWLLVDFWRRNSQLRQPAAMARWATGGTGLDLEMLSYALEASMVAFLGTAFFYNQLWNVWLYALIVVNLLLHHLATPPQRAMVLRGQRVSAGRLPRMQ